jgi:hypothetical protein
VALAFTGKRVGMSANTARMSAYATLALILVAVGVRMRRVDVPVPVRVARTVSPAPAEAPVIPRRPARRSRSVKSLPKERMFPLLAPLSREERNLLAYVRLQLDPIDGSRASEPIEIEPILIAPLQSDGSR